MSAVAADAALTRGGGDFDWPWAAVCEHLFLRLFLAVRVIHCFRHFRGQTGTGANAGSLLLK